MRIPTSTYRVQLRNGTTFDHVRKLVPYLKSLGVSHLYASPIFTAVPGSTHGYDVVNPNEIDPVIGGRDAFVQMVEALKSEGLGLILDIVPNHMAASLENPWWRDVVENGEQSRYARHFDIDWTRKLTLPFLGDTFEAVLERGELALRPDPHTGKPSFKYFESYYPLKPSTYGDDRGQLADDGDPSALGQLHDRQVYRLTSWRDARHSLSYRRFFEITGLAGVRVEDEPVFAETHQLVLELVRDGLVDGLRVDHVDGLADPGAYLQRLRENVGPDCYITVEKILADGEMLPHSWPISGSTGYEFITALHDVFVNGDQLAALRAGYEAVVGKAVDPANELRSAKSLMVDRNFAGEFATLVAIAEEIAAEDEQPCLSTPSTRTALRELLIAFPLYRTYGDEAGLSPNDRRLLAEVIDGVAKNAVAAVASAARFVEKILRGDVVGANPRTAEFRTRFQQLTGPLTAKSLEDTLFFRQHAALALNEVGSEPFRSDFSIDRFHEEMAKRLHSQPDGLSATSTHDTKRGEDARARLYTITEEPKVWMTAVDRWRKMNAGAVRPLDDGPAPEPEVEWMIYQSLMGVWPLELDFTDPAGLQELEQRFTQYLQKALREAKLRTDWAEPKSEYEDAVIDFARHLLSPQNQGFLKDFYETIQPFVGAGLVNSLTQAIVKMTAPGVPDIYQGAESLDLSLVDPDNRRAPDYDVLQTMLADSKHGGSKPDADLQTGALKQQVIAALARLRREVPDLFQKGNYIPLQPIGPAELSLLSFARSKGDEALIVLAARKVARHFVSNSSPSWPSVWERSRLPLPEALHGGRYVDVMTGQSFSIDNAIDLPRVLNDRYFAILRRAPKLPLEGCTVSA